MKEKSNKLYSYKWVVPAVILYFIFFLLPSLQGIYYSFTYWNIHDARFAGLVNYTSIFTDSNLNIAVKNTLIFAIISTVSKVGIGLILALLLNGNFRSVKVLRSIYFLPCIISNVAIALIFSSVLHPIGIINTMLNTIGLGSLAQDWLTNTSIVIYSVSAIEVWKWSGFTMIIILAGLQTIPVEYYEAANVDGVTGFNRFRYITLPLLMPSFNNALILNLIGGLKIFDLVYAMTGGGPGNASEVLNSYVFKAYGNGLYGEACAASVIVAVLVVIISMATYKPLRKMEVEG